MLLGKTIGLMSLVWLYDLPNLSFLAFAGNPCVQIPTNIELQEFSESDLELGHILGKGASGTIYHANCASLGQTVAVKLFTGNITSDGSPCTFPKNTVRQLLIVLVDEMRACLAAGCHVNLIDTIGRLRHREMHMEGIILQLISASYTILGQPPSLESCSRDCYAVDLALKYDWVLSILIGIASAASHLHRLGIAHGGNTLDLKLFRVLIKPDLYAHNILVNDIGHALLGDFGAATIYGIDHEQRALIERLEVKAFGHLMEDLHERTIFDNKDRQAGKLLDLQKHCQQNNVHERPDFPAIVAELISVQSQRELL